MSSIVVLGESYPSIQINGQKLIGPCENWRKLNTKPDLFKELFINKIPHHLTEFELLPIFASVGPIWQFRLMMNFSGRNRGFAYVQYVHDESYEKAFKLLNGRLFPPGYRVSIMVSRNICSLLLGGVDERLDKNQIIKTIDSLICIKDICIHANDRGSMHFVLTFYSHRDTALSRRKLLQYLAAFGDNAWVRWGAR